jgi:hypothetical protein
MTAPGAEVEDGGPPPERRGARAPVGILVGLAVAAVAIVGFGSFMILRGGQTAFTDTPPLTEGLRDADWTYRDGAYRDFSMLFDRVPKTQATFDEAGRLHFLHLVSDRRLRRVSVAPDGTRTQVEVPLPEPAMAVRALSASPDAVHALLEVGPGDGVVVAVPTTGDAGVVWARPPAGPASLGLLDVEGDRLAVAALGGAVHVAALPLEAEGLRSWGPVDETRVQSLAVLPDGRVLVGGEGGIVASSAGEGWTVERLPEGDAVPRVGHDRFGRPLAVTGDGRVLSSATGWQPIGGLPSTPLALVDARRYGLVAPLDDGRVFVSLDGTEFGELPGFESLGGPVRRAEVLGDNIALFGAQEIVVYDGLDRWTTRDARGGPPTDRGVRLETCVRVPPVRMDSPTLPFRMVCDGAPVTLSSEGLEPLSTVTLGGHAVPEADFAAALEEVARRPHLVAGGFLWSVTDDGVERWDPATGAWQTIRLGAGRDTPPRGLDLDVVALDDGDARVWRVDASHHVDVATVPRSLPAGEAVPWRSVLTEDAVRENLGEVFPVRTASLRELDATRAVLVYGGTTPLLVGEERAPEILRLGVGPDVPLRWFLRVGNGVDVQRFGDRVFAATEDRLYRLEPDGPRPVEVEGVEGRVDLPSDRWLERGGEVHFQLRRRLVACAAEGERCRAVSPAPIRVRDWAPMTDDRLALFVLLRDLGRAYGTAEPLSGVGYGTLDLNAL